MRVVSLVPSLTETLFELGLGEEEIVGVTPFCEHPVERVANVEKVGGTKNPKVERILELAPDLVLANHEENRRDDVEALREGGLEVLVTEIRTVAETALEVRRVGRAVDREQEANLLATSIESELERLAAETHGEPPVLVYCPIWRKPWMTLGGDTYASDALRVAGARNVYADETRYPEASPEDGRKRGAAAAFLPSEPYPFKAKHRSDFLHAGFAAEHVALIDGQALTWYGTRTVWGLRELRRAVTALPSTP